MSTYFRRAMESQLRQREELAAALASQSAGISIFHRIPVSGGSVLILLAVASGILSLRHASKEYHQVAENFSSESFLRTLQKQFKNKQNQITAKSTPAVESKNTTDTKSPIASNYKQATEEQARQLQKLEDEANPKPSNEAPDSPKQAYREPLSTEKNLLEPEEKISGRAPAQTSENLYTWVKVPPMTIGEDSKEFPDL